MKVEAAQRYPLSWPAGWKRTTARERKGAHFRRSIRGVDPKTGQIVAGASERALTVSDALERLEQQLRLLGAVAEILSTNVPVRLSGLPASGQREPDDPGAAIYFQLLKKDQVLACDRWKRVADNIAAIALHVDAVRRIERYGVGTLEQAFAGYTAIGPAPVEWWLILGVKADATLDQVEEAFRALAREHHPDRGGDPERMKQLTAARACARQALA